MKKISVLDRILLLATGLLAAYQVAAGMDGMEPLTIWFYTVSFGTVLVAGLLLIILGFEGLEKQAIVIVSTLIPLSLSLGLVSEHMVEYTIPYLIFCGVGFIAIAITRFSVTGRIATIVLAVVHGIAGLIIFLLPIFLSIQGAMPAGFALVGLGGAIIGLGGLLLAFLKAGKPILSQKTILTLLPGLLFLMTAAFVCGFSFR
ncbi:MAG: hypothetical protein KAU23_04495 [Anaerolineales bacterium]|nr:hypothetical protein [Anaerolineales bacterium]